MTRSLLLGILFAAITAVCPAATSRPTLGSDGHFEFTSLPAGTYSIYPSVKGYHIKGTRNRPFALPVSIDHDLDGFTITIYSGPYNPNTLPN
jgi:hypothetical protein